MAQPRSCDLYNVPEEDCECKIMCGTTHNSCPEHSEQALASWQSQPSTSSNKLNAESCSDSSAPPSVSSKELSSHTSVMNENEESVAEILEKYERYKEFISICLAISTSSLTSALKDYRRFVLKCSFWRSEEPVIREFYRIVELANSQTYVEEVDVYKMAEVMMGDPCEGNSSSTWRTYLAARKYRMLVQWSCGKFGLDGDILKEIESLLDIWKREGRPENKCETQASWISD